MVGRSGRGSSLMKRVNCSSPPRTRECGWIFQRSGALPSRSPLVPPKTCCYPEVDASDCQIVIVLPMDMRDVFAQIRIFQPLLWFSASLCKGRGIIDQQADPMYVHLSVRALWRLSVRCNMKKQMPLLHVNLVVDGGKSERTSVSNC